MADPIRLLREQQEKRLLALGDQRSQRQQRLSALDLRQRQLQGLVGEYSGCGAEQNVLLLRNRSQMGQQLRPLISQCERQLEVAKQDLASIDRQWQRQLGRRQGLVWLEEENARTAQRVALRNEQKQMDEFAARANKARR
ncbi:flagellar export protein FliJ [Ferrimonas pelagia]|uniref:Flagellar FliJ protein n=1 Tax=Ferrimonas pelagia TaxID=1177826 RepID=A0ABP9EXH9_9GAMM